MAGVTCGVLEFEEIGTYVNYSYMICNAILDDMRKVVDTVFRETVKGLSLDPLQLQKNFNPWFVNSDKVQLKIRRVSRELMYSYEEIFFGRGEDKKTALG